MAEVTDCRRTVVFAGPSLYGLTVEVQAEVRPPIRSGDMLALPGIEDGSCSIGLIDGEFGQSLAVTVAEIREVLSCGNRVVGGASMGALRAVECAPLGMEGAGWIVERYRDGSLFSDAEVALTYDPETFRPLTVPLVNLRWLSLRIAAVQGDTRGHADLLARAQAIPFARRDLAALRALVHECIPNDAAEAWAENLDERHLAAWDRKQADALAVLDALRRPRAARVTWEPAPPALPRALEEALSA